MSVASAATCNIFLVMLAMELAEDGRGLDSPPVVFVYWYPCSRSCSETLNQELSTIREGPCPSDVMVPLRRSNICHAVSQLFLLFNSVPGHVVVEKDADEDSASGTVSVSVEKALFID